MAIIKVLDTVLDAILTHGIPDLSNPEMEELVAEIKKTNPKTQPTWERRIQLEELQAKLQGGEMVTITQDRLGELLLKEDREAWLQIERSRLFTAIPDWMGFTGDGEIRINCLIAWINAYRWITPQSAEERIKIYGEIAQKYEAENLILKHVIREVGLRGEPYDEGHRGAGQSLNASEPGDFIQTQSVDLREVFSEQF